MGTHFLRNNVSDGAANFVCFSINSTILEFVNLCNGIFDFKNALVKSIANSLELLFCVDDGKLVKSDCFFMFSSFNMLSYLAILFGIHFFITH